MTDFFSSFNRKNRLSLILRQSKTKRLKTTKGEINLSPSIHTRRLIPLPLSDPILDPVGVFDRLVNIKPLSFWPWIRINIIYLKILEAKHG